MFAESTLHRMSPYAIWIGLKHGAKHEKEVVYEALERSVYHISLITTTRYCTSRECSNAVRRRAVARLGWTTSYLGDYDMSCALWSGLHIAYSTFAIA